MDVDDEEIAVGSVSSAPAPSPGPSSAVQAVQSNHIKNIKICNFNSFDGMVTIFGIQKKNNLISNLDTGKLISQTIRIFYIEMIEMHMPTMWQQFSIHFL